MLTDKEQLIEELEEHIAQVRKATFKNPFLNLFNDPGVVQNFKVESKILFDIIGSHYFHNHAPIILIKGTLDEIRRYVWNLQ